MVLPLCHLYEIQDERTCREFDFPVIMSGHDHHRVDRVVEGTRLLKPGMDAHAAIVMVNTLSTVKNYGWPLLMKKLYNPWHVFLRQNGIFAKNKKGSQT